MHSSIRYLSIFVLFSKAFCSLPCDDIDYKYTTERPLISNKEHIDFAKHALETARESVIITSYSMDYQFLMDSGIGQGIQDAAARKIQVSLFCSPKAKNSKDYSLFLAFLKDCTVGYSELPCHAKCVVRDQDLVALGSFDWLAKPFENGHNTSLIVKNIHATQVKKDILDCISYYQNTSSRISNYIELPLDTDANEPSKEREIYYTLKTPEAHQEILHTVFANAQKRIILSSPFIRLDRLKETLCEQRLRPLAQKGVLVQLRLLSNPCTNTPFEKERIFSYLQTLRSNFSNFIFETMHNMHEKTLIADEDFVCVGSFNWLSAAPNLTHHANNFEMSVALKGNVAASITRLLGASRAPYGASPILAAPKQNCGANDNIAGKKRKVLAEITPSTRQKACNHLISPKEDYVVFSGAPYNKPGFCVKFSFYGYMKNSNAQILYFTTEEQAHKAARAFH